MAIDGLPTLGNLVALVVAIAIAFALIWASYETPPSPAEARALRERPRLREALGERPPSRLSRRPPPDAATPAAGGAPVAPRPRRRTMPKAARRVSLTPPDGTRYVLPHGAARRAEVVATLRELYRGWGYDLVEVPALERYDATHPRQAQSFKLSDRDSGVLALRSDFTPALAQLVRAHYPAVAGGARRPLRWQYGGTVWHAIDPELARTREFTQVGLELIGVSNARADAEIIHLARESVRVVGLRPRLEVGNPGFVRALLDVAGVPAAAREAGVGRDAIADAIDRKDRRDLFELLTRAGLDDLPGSPMRALLAVPDLYGGVDTLDRARLVRPGPRPSARSVASRASWPSSRTRASSCSTWRWRAGWRTTPA
jgi:hypothetical protein